MVSSTSATAATDFVRALSPAERWFWIIDRISPANCTARVRVDGAITGTQLAWAAAALVAEYPLLRVGVREVRSRHPRLVALADPVIPVRRVVSADAEAWRSELDAELVEPFETAAGLARIVDIAHEAGTSGEYHDVLLTVSHIVMDGRSLMTLLRKLIRYADLDGRDGAGAGRVPMPASDDLIPAGARGFWRYVYTNLYDQTAALLLRPRRLTGVLPVPLPDRRTKVVHRTLDAQTLAALALDCRRAGVTIHGALAAAVARAIGNAVRPGSSGVAGIGSPVDYRPLLSPTPDSEELGIYAPVLTNFVRFGPRESLWEAARKVNLQLERGIRRRRHLTTVAGMRFGTPRTVASGRRIVDMVDRRAPWNVSVTNLGRVEFPDRVGAWRLSEVVITGSNSCVSALTVAIVTAHEQMRIGFCYVEGISSAARTEVFADHVLAELTDRLDPAVLSTTVN